MTIMRTAITLSILFICTANTYGASFDCAKASSQVEILICSNAELSQLDERLAVAYEQGIVRSNNKIEFKSSQRHWLIEKRNTCTDVPCIKNAYEARLYKIEQGQGESATVISVTTDPVTGTWERHTSQGTLKTLLDGKNVHFELEIYSGAPTYNFGFIEGEFELHERKGIFNSREYDKCTITFVFYPDKVTLESAYNSDCGFGHAVYAIGTFYLRNKEEPVFTGDPRM